MKAFFEGVSGIKELETLRDDEAYMREIAERVNSILESSSGVEQNNSTTAESGVVNYSLGDKLSEEVNNYPYKEFRNGKTRNARTITFALKIDGTFYLVVAVPEASKKTIWINTAFISKKIEANQFRNASNRPLRYTPKNETDSASNNSISNNTEKSNSSFQVSDTDYLEAARNGDEEKGGGVCGTGNNATR